MQRAASDEKRDRPKGQFPDKLFYKIGEVSRLTGVESYVLRYWETEFQFLRPRKSKSGQRIYVKKDLEVIMMIKELLYGERLTLEGVRRRLGESGMAHPGKPNIVQDAAPASDLSPIDRVKQRLRDILARMS